MINLCENNFHNDRNLLQKLVLYIDYNYKHWQSFANKKHWQSFVNK